MRKTVGHLNKEKKVIIGFRGKGGVWVDFKEALFWKAQNPTV